MRKQLTLVTTFASALGATPALADSTPDPKMEVGAFVGYHLFNQDNQLGAPSSGPRETLDDSPVFGIRLARHLSHAITAEGELALSPAQTSPSNTDVVGIGYRLHLLVHPFHFARLEPFAVVGLGGLTAASSDRTVFANDVELEGHAGLGFKYRIGRDWGMRVDARLIIAPAFGGGATDEGELLVGIYKTFAPKPAAVPAPPPVDAPPPPPPAPRDSDADNVLDGADKCPSEPEDRDGFADDDGCPDPDNDGDGIADAEDKCPGDVETKNGYQDDDGCPDEAPAAIKQFTGVIGGIDFATGSDKLTPSSSKTLDQAVKVLGDYPTLRLEISGHTDNTGDAAFNRELSRKRAESVKAYFVAHGIAADRLETVGRGPDVPIGDNATAEGRAKNRRVEFAPR